MNLFHKKRSKEFDAISVAFTRSLRNLEIEPNRFRTLPLRQRKLAMCEAIYQTAKQVSGELDWYLDRTDLHSKRLWDFTPNQIAQHQTVVDSLIALVCLGESSFVRPLVTYLSFPESRWAILIDSVLRAISVDPIRGSVFRIPTESERATWRKWAIEHPEPPKLKDYSDILLSDIGTEDIKWNFFCPPEISESSFLINRNEFFETEWKYFDEKQANYCTRILYSPLKSYDYNAFAESVEAFVNTNPFEGNFNTLVACVNDWINELHLSKPTLKQNWLPLVARKKVSSRTGAILFQILVYPRKDRQLAREFGKEILSKDVNLQTLSTLTDILTQCQTANSVYRIVKLYSDIDSLSEQTRETIIGLTPMASTTLILWIKNLFSREIESLCILGGELPRKRSSLLDRIKKMFKSNDQAIVRLKFFEHSSNPHCQKLGLQMRYFHEHRKPFESQLDMNYLNTHLLVSNYLNVVKTTFRELKRLESAKLGSSEDAPSSGAG